jgi:RimJ/RimL family protein N-acetyltransferase
MKVIYTNKEDEIEIQISESYTPDYVSFAESIMWGQEGLLYRMFGLALEFLKLKHPMYISTFKSGQLIGIALVNRKEVELQSGEIDAFYSCIWGVAPAYTNQGYCTLMINNVTDYIFENYPKSIIYSFIELGNKRSKRVTEKINYSLLTNFVAPNYIRLHPKPSPNVSLLKPTEKQLVIQLLKKQYKGHSFLDVEDTFDESAYYVYKENGKIKAGVQVKKLRWSIINMLGFEGFMLLKVIPRVKILNDQINMKNHTFLKMGNMFISDQKNFHTLVDSLLSTYNLKSAVAFTLHDSPVDAKILSVMKTGILSSIETKVGTYYRSQNLSVEEIGKLPFISMDDFL